MAQARTWLFTAFNIDYWYNLLSNWSTIGLPHNHKVRYIVAQLEICPTSGRRHFQGYFELNDKCRIAALKKLFVDDTANYEQRKGSADQCRKYCTKTETRDPANICFEIGEFKGHQGKRNDWEAIKEMIHNGAEYKDILIEFPGIATRCKGGIGELIIALNPNGDKRERRTHVYVLAGEPGTGKSTAAKKMTTIYYPNNPPDYYTLGCVKGDNIWFDGYDPLKHKRIIIDEFCSNIPLSYFNMLFDEHGATVRVKGGMVPFLADEVIITSNIHPKDWYPGITNPSRRKSFFRRITCAWWHKKVGKNVVKQKINLYTPEPDMNFVPYEDYMKDLDGVVPTEMVVDESPSTNGTKIWDGTDEGVILSPSSAQIPESQTLETPDNIENNRKPARTLGRSDAVNEIAKQIRLLVINESQQDEVNFGYND